MKILFLHEVNYLEKPIFEMHEFPEYLAQRGHQVAFLHFPEGYNKNDIRALGWAKVIAGRVIPKVELKLYTPQISSGSLFSRLRYSLFAGCSIRGVFGDFRPDIVVSFAVPTSGWQALKVAKKQGIPYVFRALDVSHKIRASFFSPLIKLAEKYIYTNSELVSTNNPAMAKYCRSLGAKQAVTKVHLPPLNLEHFFNAKERSGSLRAELNIPSSANVILYMGSFFYFSGLPEVMTRFSEISESNDYLVLVGGGEQDQELRELSKELKLTRRVIFTGFVSFDNLPKYLGLADVAINPMIPSLVSNAAFPNKVIQYMAAGLPVVSTNLEGLMMTFESNKSLKFESNPKSVIESALELLRDRGSLRAMGESNKATIANLFSREGAVKEFENALLSLGEKK